MCFMLLQKNPKARVFAGASAQCPENHTECILILEKIYLSCVGSFFFWLIMAIYLGNVIPDPNGVRKPLLYFLNPSYWSGRNDNKMEEGNIFSWLFRIPPPENIKPEHEDVLSEETIVKHQADENELDQNVAIQIRGLVKSYPGAISFGCRKISNGKPFHAVKRIWLNLQKNQLFCLLGPNGAGKTTTISCLTGTSPVTRGDGNVYTCYGYVYFHLADKNSLYADIIDSRMLGKKFRRFIQ